MESVHEGAGRLDLWGPAADCISRSPVVRSVARMSRIRAHRRHSGGHTGSACCITTTAAGHLVVLGGKLNTWLLSDAGR